jgi:hypothetical protein
MRADLRLTDHIRRLLPEPQSDGRCAWMTDHGA